MRILKLKIENPELEKQLEGYEDQCEYRWLTPKERSNDQSALLFAGRIFRGGEFFSGLGIFLTPKPKPLPEPDWSKATMLKRKLWLTIDHMGVSCFEGRPTFVVDGYWQAVGKTEYFCFVLNPKYYDLSWLPEVPPERFSEACWQVP